MATLNQTLHQTTHKSSLLRKAGRFGFSEISDLVQLAVQRGCTHYKNTLASDSVLDPGIAVISDVELVVLLIHGGQPYEPNAIRCAAQLLKSPGLNPQELSFLAVRERCELTLHYIASMGLLHDCESMDFWNQILSGLHSPQRDVEEGIFPHYSRFMLNPGLQRGGAKPSRWLSPTR